MKYGSVCSGIEAATAAWHQIGWKPAFFSEIEGAPRAVLTEHFPHVPCHGDFTTIKEKEYDPIELLVGGTPCQDFSIAGLRKGITGDRGNLTLEFLRLAQRLRPQWLVWENVPGVLSDDGGRSFGAVLGGMGELGYGTAYRILDAQFYGVAQRRRRVFVVGYLGDWRPPAAVLSDAESLSGNPPPSREAGQRIAGTLTARSGGGGGGPGASTDEAAAGYLQPISHTLTGEGFDASEDGTGRGVPIVAGAMTAEVYSGGMGGRVDAAVQGYAIPYRMEAFGEYTEDGTASTVKARDFKDATDLVAYDVTFCDANGRRADRPNGGLYVNETATSKTLTAGGDMSTYICDKSVAFPLDLRNATRDPEKLDDQNRQGCGTGEAGGNTSFSIGEKAGTLRGDGHGGGHSAIMQRMAVRRLTPRECERLQGFPDDWTLVPYRGRPPPDAPRMREAARIPR